MNNVFEEFVSNTSVDHYKIPMWGLLRAPLVPAEIKKQGLGEVSFDRLMAIAVAHEAVKAICILCSLWAFFTNSINLSDGLDYNTQRTLYIALAAVTYQVTSYYERLAIEGVNIPGKSGN